MRAIILLFLTGFSLLPAISQEVRFTKVTGNVLDTLFRPVEYAAVQLYPISDTGNTYGAITQADGSYLIKNVQASKYIVKASAIGFSVDSFQIDLANVKATTPMKLIRLREAPIEMDEVTVTGIRTGYTEKVDKTVFVPDSFTLQTAKTGIDVMRRIPEVKVDNKDQRVSILGNKNILVLINGMDNKRSLASIHPADIERIEVITHPSVKYAADVASVINIVLKGYKEKGLTLSANTYVCVNKKNHSGNMQIDYQTGKLRFFGSYSGQLSLNESSDSTLRYDFDDDNSRLYVTLPLVDNRSDFSRQQGQFGFDFNANKNNLFSHTATIRNYSFLSYREKEIRADADSKPSEYSRIRSRYQSDRLEQSYSFYYLHKFRKEGASLVIGSNFGIIDDKSDYAIFDSTFLPVTHAMYSQRSILKAERQLSNNTKIDYTLPLGKRLQLESGYQLYYRSITNAVNASEGKDVGTLYSDWRNAVYSNIAFAPKKLGIQAGARVELFSLNVNQLNFTRARILPYGSVIYNAGQNQSLKLTYRNFLTYPHYTNLNPYRYYAADSLSYLAGNPNLTPEQKHTVNLKYTFRSKDLHVSASTHYNHLSGIIVPHASLNNDIVGYTYSNLGKASQYGGDLSLSYEVFGWAELELQLRCMYIEFLDNPGHNGFAYAAEAGIVAPLPAGIDLEIYGLIGEKEIDYNGWSRYGGYIDEILISKDIFKNMFLGLAVWQPFIKVFDTDKRWNKSFSETNYYTEVNSVSYMVNLVYYFKSGRKITKIDKMKIDENNKEQKSTIRR